MPITRNHLFRGAAVFAIAMVVGAWTTSKRGGEDTLTIDLHMDGYVSGVPTKAPSTLCIFHNNHYGTGQAPFTVVWSGDIFNYQGSSISEDEYLPSSADTYTQCADVTDAAMGNDSDCIEVPVGSAGEGCEG
jgi:hypothetical protein